MSDPFIGEIRAFPYVTATQRLPSNIWLPCNGATYKIADYQALFALIGTTYGGDGVNRFGVPNLSGSVPIGQGTMPGGSITYKLGQTVGEESVTLTPGQMPMHSHQLTAANGTQTITPSPGTVFGGDDGGTYRHYASPPQTTTNWVPLNANVLESAGGSQGHDNIMPCIAMAYFIAALGIFPDLNS